MSRGYRFRFRKHRLTVYIVLMDRAMLAACVFEDGAAIVALHYFKFVYLMFLAAYTSAVNKRVAVAPASPVVGFVSILALLRPVLLCVFP